MCFVGLRLCAGYGLVFVFILDRRCLFCGVASVCHHAACKHLSYLFAGLLYTLAMGEACCTILHITVCAIYT